MVLVEAAMYLYGGGCDGQQTVSYYTTLGISTVAVATDSHNPTPARRLLV